jgi:serine/threonine protein kinase
MGSGTWNVFEDLTPPRYEVIACRRENDHTALFSAWEHGLQTVTMSVKDTTTSQAQDPKGIKSKDRAAGAESSPMETGPTNQSEKTQVRQQRMRQRWRQVAVKVAKLENDTTANASIAKEADILRDLCAASESVEGNAHSAAISNFCLPCPRFYEVGEHQGRAFLSMDLLGPTIKQLLEAEGTLSPSVTYALGARIALNIYKTHACGWIHNNVAPESILVGRGEDCGNLYLAGFTKAIAVAAGAAHSGDSSNGTTPDQPLDLYASEQKHLGGEASRTDDLWSLFYVLLECIAGKLPWMGAEDNREVLRAKQECLAKPALYTKSLDGTKTLPPGLASFHESLRRLDFGNDFSYLNILGKMLQEAGEKSIDDPAAMQYLRLDQMQWPVAMASTLTELSIVVGSKTSQTTVVNTNGATPTNGTNTPSRKIIGQDMGAEIQKLTTITRKGSGMLSGLVQTLSACLTPPSVFSTPENEGQAKEALQAVLDSSNVEDENGAAEDMDIVEDAQADKSLPTDVSMIAESFYREQKARVEAEVQARDKEQRLKVAQTQLVEYASQQARDASNMRTKGDEVLSKASDPDSAKLLDMIQQHELEATAFHNQQCSDLEKAKDVAATSTVAQQDTAVVPDESEKDNLDISPNVGSATLTDDYLERAKYIPLRLSLSDRRLLRLLEAALNVSEYTDKVDVVSYRSKHHRINQQLRDMCAILCGLVVAQNYKKGKELIEGKEFKDNADFFQDVFEIGRRHKILNPEKMRTEYGKLLYMLMDSQLGDVQGLLEFKCVRQLKTVYSLLSDKGAIGVLKDDLIATATEEIKVGNRRRYEIQKDIRKKEKAREMLASKYCNRSISRDEILNCLYSIGDNNSYLFYNRDPVDKMIDLLQTHFSATDFESSAFSLAIVGGVDGARLSHSHQRQYTFVLQSLTLWREISHDMFKLWYLAEKDILGENNRYTLADTGQGLNRIQRAPSVYKAIHGIISRCQRRIGSWVGSSVVHLGDHNVPNALMFIDKYTQVPRILSPVVLVIEAIPGLCKDPDLASYFDNAFGGVDNLINTILTDFFRHGFDGSGADNFFDAGSCIDGRLTSAWNWCSKIEKKNYFPVFKLAGFAGFDGDFR